MPELFRMTSDIDSGFERIVHKPFPDQAYIAEEGTVGYRESQRGDYILGDPHLPVAVYRELITDTVKSNLITIITAKTGTGKSTNVPQYLFESGFEKVYITQPRILAARELKTHVANDMADSLREREHRLVGYQTAMEGDSSDDNAIEFVTDGLQLMREISQHGVLEDEVLIIDEFHERNANMDALLAVAVKKGIRIVIMSATLDAEAISKHYEGVTQQPVPVIDIPGMTYEVTESESGDLDATIVSQAKQGKNILVFLPGRKEINDVMSRMRRRVADSYTLLALHGDQTPDEQRRVMRMYDGGKIIFSTSIGQTSITIADIDTVIDCGFERTMTLDEYGKDCLTTQLASKATSEQRRGRVGRTKPGNYILAQLRGYPQLPRLEDRPNYDIPEIKRTQLHSTSLRLAAFGQSVLSLPFYDRPDDKEITRAYESLERLQCVKKIGKTALDGYEITDMGSIASRLPLDPHSARMVIESRKYGPKIEIQMMAAAVVAQIRGITHTARGMEKWRKLTDEEDSDIIAGIDFMVAALQRTEDEQNKSHIVKTRYDKALRALEQLAKRRNLDMYDLVVPDEEDREKLLRCIVAGMEELFVLNGKSYVDDNGKRRQIVNSSIIPTGNTLLAGASLDLQQIRRREIKSNLLITATSSIDIEMLEATIPERVEMTIEKLYIDDAGTPKTIQRLYFDGRRTRYEIEREASPSPELQRFMIEHIFSAKMIPGLRGDNIKKARSLLADFRRLQHKTSEDLGIEYSLQHSIIDVMIRESNFQSITFDDIDPFINIDSIESIIPVEIRDEINAQAPDTLTITIDQREMTLKVKYHDSAAYVTVQPQYYDAVPFTIGNNHKVFVKPSDKHVDYMSVGKARDAYAAERMRPTRQSRRGTMNIDIENRVVKKHSMSAPRQYPSNNPRTVRRSR